MKRLAIIGGGAAGLMCAATILEDERSRESVHITLYDRNPHLGAKVIISGGGRCNVTTGHTAWRDLADKYVRGADNVERLFARFGPREIRMWFERHHVALKEESDKRIFPVSNDGHDVVTAFERLFAEHATQITCACSTPISSLTRDAQRDTFTLTTKDGTQSSYDSVVIATGGNAYAHTGSRGDGYAFARSLGHTITPLGPSLASLEVSPPWLHMLSGQSFPHAALTTSISGRHTMVSAPLLITHFGISGPAAFTLAAHLAFTTISPRAPHELRLIPDQRLSASLWDQHLVEAIQAAGRKKCHRHLETHLPKGFVAAFLDAAFPDLPEKSAEISKAQRKAITDYLGNGIPLSVIGRRAGDEFVTAGGVDLSEISRDTCASLIAPGAYLIGEVLDIDGVTGGYNLSSSWSSGHAAARHIISQLHTL